MSGYLSSNAPVVSSTGGYSESELQAATALSALLSSTETHRTRNPVGGKPERAALRHAKRHGLTQTFNRKGGAYVPAWATAAGAPQGGTSAFQDVRRGKRPMLLNTLELLEEMSESSEEEPEKRKRRAGDKEDEEE